MSSWLLPSCSRHRAVMVSSRIVTASQQEPYYYGYFPTFFSRPGQDQAQYLPPTQQYPVTSGAAGFSLRSSPAVYPDHGEGLRPRPTATKHSLKHGGLSVQRAEIRHQNPKDESEETRELYGRLRSILNKLTPEKFPELMKQVMDLKIDTQEKLMGAVDVILWKALAEPDLSMTCAKIGRRLMEIRKEAEMEEHWAHIKVQADLRPAGFRRSLTRSQ